MDDRQDCSYKTRLAGPREHGDDGSVGCLPALSRAVLGGESLFLNVYESDPAKGGWVTLAAGQAGEVVIVDIDPDRELFVIPGAFLGCRSNVQSDAKCARAHDSRRRPPLFDSATVPALTMTSNFSLLRSQVEGHQGTFCR